MEPQFVDRPAFTVLGVQVRLNPMTADYPAIWGRLFQPRAGEIQPLSLGDECYGIYFATDEPGMDDYVAGMAVPPGTQARMGFVVREVPAAHDAVFECTIATIAATWRAIFEEWMPKSGFEPDLSAPAMERYAAGCCEESSPVTIHVPVRPVKTR
jgi:AraC family transcriptional regulator